LESLAKGATKGVLEHAEELSDKTKMLVDKLDGFAKEGVICRDIGEDKPGETLKSPFLRFYP